ncbi:hypothetical protein [Hymenobacter nivis]|nr:hypothetical protein [Hymenobacter nivis]
MLQTSTTHHFRVTSAVTLLFLLTTFASFGQPRYQWQPLTDSNWDTAANWVPTRLSPAATDVLVFDGTFTPSTSVTLDFTASQNIGQLIFINRVQATLNTVGSQTLVIGAQSPAVGLQMDAGTLVQVVGRLGSSNSSLAMQLAVGTRAAIAGRLEFSGNASFTSSHTLLSATAKAIEFTGGSYFLSGTTFEGFPFGSLTANTESVVFRSGATFEQAGGRSPFGERTYAVTIFDLGSYYLYTAGGTGSVGLSGRTFGYLTVNANRTPTAGTYGANKVIIQNDLMILSGTHTFNEAV